MIFETARNRELLLQHLERALMRSKSTSDLVLQAATTNEEDRLRIFPAREREQGMTLSKWGIMIQYPDENSFHLSIATAPTASAKRVWQLSYLRAVVDTNRPEIQLHATGLKLPEMQQPSNLWATSVLTEDLMISTKLRKPSCVVRTCCLNMSDGYEIR
ncbi:hypothetical protein PsorP6_019320 [Peronosclerospora sorghi]|nr:hypothetical protein PsorP6_019320 [Peronosclerospora sorghi]